jgi:hypothetical protein
MKKVVLKWPRTIPKRINKARHVLSCMTQNVLVYPNPDPTLQEVKDKVDELVMLAAAAEYGGTDRTLARNVCAEELTTLMNRLVVYVQLVSQGNVLLTSKAGMDTKDDYTKWPRPSKVTALGANPGGNAGTILLFWDAVDFKKMYVIERYVEDGEVLPGVMPQSGGRWEQITTLGSRKYLVSGLVTGGMYRFRVAATNSAGMGDYSEPITCVAR